MRNVTIKDVAKESGYSLSTVSRVLSNSDYPVSPDAKSKIKKTANDLGYISNFLARSLKTSVSKEIAVIMPTITNPFYNSLVYGTGTVLSSSGYTMFVSYYDNTDKSNEVFQIARSRMADGIIIAADCVNSNSIKRIQQIITEVPIVFVDYYPSSILRPTGVFFDYYKGGRKVVDFLLGKGHTKIAFVSKPLTMPSRINRRDGYIDAMHDAGIDCSYSDIFISNRDDFDAGRELTDRILNSKKKYTAIAASNDAMAVGVLSGLSEHGLHIPQDISVIGFDDCVYSRMSSPLLTTVRVPAEEMGASAAKMLLSMLNNTSPNSQFILPKIIERNSVLFCNSRSTYY